MKAIRLVLVLVVSIAMATHAIAQPAAGQREGGSRARRAGGDLPEVGAMVPDITLYDADGQEFPTSRLRGHYSVLVFGCLT